MPPEFDNVHVGISKIITDNNLESLQPQLKSVHNVLSNIEKLIDVVILGEFKAGKSSFINSLFGFHVLPTGVTPVTSVITRVRYGGASKAVVIFKGGEKIIIGVNEIEDYVSETKNHENYKNVLMVEVQSPELEDFKSLRFIDTPGLESFFKHNSDTTDAFMPEIGIAIVVISAERPLSQNDILLVRETLKHTSKVNILLTKTDLFDGRQLNEITEFVRNSLSSAFSQQFRIYPYSIYRHTETYRATICNELITPLMANVGEELEKLLRHKLRSLTTACIGLLEVAVKISEMKDKQLRELRDKIVDEEMNIPSIRKELGLIRDSYTATVREKIFSIMDSERECIIKTIKSDFEGSYSEWKGNLANVSGLFTEYENKKLSENLISAFERRQPSIQEILQEPKLHFEKYVDFFTERLNNNVKKVFDITLNFERWQPDRIEVMSPDIRVSRNFDFPIDLISFLFPMLIFKNVFKKHFSRQISVDTEKNLRRLTSDITVIISKGIADIFQQSLRHISEQLQTIDGLLSDKKYNSEELTSSIEYMKDQLVTL